MQFRIRVQSGELVPNGDGSYRELTPEEKQRRDALHVQAEHDREERQKREQRTRALAQAQAQWQSSGTPPRYFTADLDAIGKAPDEYVRIADDLRRILDDPALLALVGGRGTGKTWMACALVRQFCRRRKTARYLTAMNIFRGIRDAWDRPRGSGDSERAAIDKLAKIDLLVVDEIQVRASSEWENNLLTDLLDQRYAAVRATVLISNLTPKEFQANVGDSVTSRLIGSGWIHICAWPSFRHPGAEVIAPPGTWPNGRFVFPPVMVGAIPTDGTYSNQRTDY